MAKIPNTNASKSSDQELSISLGAGSRTAFAEIYERYWSLLLSHAIKMLKDEEKAQDAVQDVFQMLWEKSPTLNIHTSLSSFLYTSLRYRILDKLKRDKIEDRFLTTLQTEIESGVSSTDDAMAEKEFARKIEEGLNMLPPKMRTVFELSRMNDYSYREISKELNLSENTVKKQISNSLKILRKSIQKGYLLIF
ncbi:RNA polymerase sigma-70 factor [Pedobacter sp. CFBP9032]|uniref:RNA polymerase sigma factor n=1 Tax=Pedobacter sp. CFBP9032 TaxID=3096539 RepID=UPI002A6B7A30|nr:RNA polymerase sigma-70 factor [Pedobacter sp. CFBP9032]MDY0904679.1 RNA polymerase sigma-70 factor [Pedobacter sp. CFBP9032]